MSNFICSECGMNNIDCGRKGYKTPREIELEKKLDIAVKALRSYSKPYFVTELGGYYVNSNKEIAEKALKQIKEVK